MQLLLAAGADVDQFYLDEPEASFNPLLAAAYRGYLDVIRLLLEHGASLDVELDGWSPLDYAETGRGEKHKAKQPWDEVIELLRAATQSASRP